MLEELGSNGRRGEGISVSETWIEQVISISELHSHFLFSIRWGKFGGLILLSALGHPWDIVLWDWLEKSGLDCVEMAGCPSCLLSA